MTEYIEKYGYLRCRDCAFETLDQHDFHEHCSAEHGLHPFSYKCTRCVFEAPIFKEMSDHIAATHCEKIVRYRCDRCNDFDTEDGTSFSNHLLSHKNFDKNRSPLSSPPKISNTGKKSPKDLTNSNSKDKKAEAEKAKIQDDRTSCNGNDKENNGKGNKEEGNGGVDAMSLSSSQNTRLAQTNSPQVSKSVFRLAKELWPNYSAPKRFKCEECAYTTNYKQELEYHMNVHRGLKPFCCPKPGCSFASSHRSNLAHHIKLIH